MDVPPSVRPPLEAYRYWPAGEMVFKGAGKHSQRFVFYAQQFTQFEVEKLSRLKAALQSQNVRLPASWDDTVLLRQAYGTNWKTRNAVAAVLKHLEWRETAIPPDYRLLFPSVLPLLHSGCLYIHGRDCFYRPCIVMQYSRFDFRSHTLEEYLPLIGFLLDFVIDAMMLPGQIENWVTITDMGKMGLSDLPISHLRKMIEVLQSNYKCRLGFNSVVNAPTSVNVVWTIIKKFLDKDTVEKISITSKPVDPILMRCFNPGQLERKYGGKAEDLTEFWPPKVPEGPFEANGMAPGALLSQKTSYREEGKAEERRERREAETGKKTEPEEKNCATGTTAQASISTKEATYDVSSVGIPTEKPLVAYPPPIPQSIEEKEVKYPEELKDSQEYSEIVAMPLVSERGIVYTESRIVMDGPVSSSLTCCGMQKCAFQKSNMCRMF